MPDLNNAAFRQAVASVSVENPSLSERSIEIVKLTIAKKLTTKEMVELLLSN